VIADAVNYAIAGIGFIHAAGRLFVRRGFTASLYTLYTVVKQNWTRRRDRCRERNISALTTFRE
jgi:hypothetical protein